MLKAILTDFTVLLSAASALKIAYRISNFMIAQAKAVEGVFRHGILKIRRNIKIKWFAHISRPIECTQTIFVSRNVGRR